MRGRGLNKMVGVVLGVVGLVLIVLSAINRDAGMLWMPWLHIVGWVVILVGVAIFTYDPEEASRAQELD